MAAPTVSEDGFKGHKLLNEAIQRYGGFTWQPKRSKPSASLRSSAGGGSKRVRLILVARGSQHASHAGTP
eukprot:s3159_g5.t1